MIVECRYLFFGSNFFLHQPLLLTESLWSFSFENKLIFVLVQDANVVKHDGLYDGNHVLGRIRRNQTSLHW